MIDREELRAANSPIFDGIVVNNEYRVTDGCFKDQLVVDAGAHIGCFSYMAREVGSAERVICIEPNEVNFKILTRFFRLDPHYALFNQALGKTYEAAKVVGNDSTSTIIDFYAGGLLLQQIKRVPLKYFTTIYSGHAHRAVLKMDIEGAEFDVLWASSIEDLTFFNTILIEIHSNEIRMNAMKDYLNVIGFEMARSDRMHAWLRNEAGHTADYKPLDSWVCRFDLKPRKKHDILA